MRESWRIAALGMALGAGSVVCAAAQAPRPGGAAEREAAAWIASRVAEGFALLEARDPLQAQRVFREIRAQAPFAVGAVVGLGRTWLLLGRPALSLRYARCAESARPRADAAALRVRALMRARRFDGAVRAAREAARRLPPTPELLLAQASALFRVQRIEDAARLYLQAVAEGEESAEAHLRLGSGLLGGAAPITPALRRAVAARRRGDLEAAIGELRAVLERAPRHAIAHRLLGEALYERAWRRGLGACAPEFRVLGEALEEPPVDEEMARTLLPDWPRLRGRRRAVAARALATFAARLPRLVAIGGRHDLLGPLERTTDAPERAELRGRRTFDGRIWDDVRGIGGLRAATGIEALDEAAWYGFDTLAHELAHQVHLYVLERADRREIRRLYERARREDRFLDYYAAMNEAEYFAQGVEAFVSYGKLPSREPTHGHTRFELFRKDPDLHALIARLVDHDPLRDPPTRDRLLRAAYDVAMRCGRFRDAVVAAEWMASGPERQARRERARHAWTAWRTH